MLAATFPDLGIGFVGVSFAFGLTVLTMAYAVGHVSGGHFNGYGDLSIGKYALASCFAIEVLTTFFFIFIIIGTTSRGAASGFAGIPIGLALTLIHLVSIPVTQTSVNPARSTGPALFAGANYVGQLWLFWVAPIVGALIAGALTRWMYEPEGIIETVVVEKRRVS